ncbi:OX-2 membrane glycoprotein isoform X2 [Amia ocellicauda]|uniref:OX-2 membrane glycoprotein isoform X2 n=1 Tax=Amia ocellicauda TaxID=2972642 RepID=UPI0034643D55
MTPVVKYVFWLSAITAHASSELVRTQRIVRAALGEAANLTCELTEPKDVLQVTWQRQNRQSAINIATYNTRFGAKISDSYREHVSFSQVGLQKCSIAIRGVTREDEVCYNCLFNSYPDGAIRGITCLSVYELYEPIFEVSTVPHHGSEHKVFLLTCSVTGRPTPTVSWSTERHDVIEDSQHYTVTNPNGTVTVTRNATIDVSRLTGKETLIKCIVEQPALESKKEIFRVIAEDVIKNQDEENRQLKVLIGVFVSVGLISVFVIIGAIFLWKCKQTKCEGKRNWLPARNDSEDKNINVGIEDSPNDMSSLLMNVEISKINVFNDDGSLSKAFKTSSPLTTNNSTDQTHLSNEKFKSTGSTMRKRNKDKENRKPRSSHPTCKRGLEYR